MSIFQRLLILLCNYIPFFQVFAILTVIIKCRHNLLLLFGLIIGIIYVIPPLFCKVALLIQPLKQERYKLFSKEYFVWWFTFCFQILYLRLPILEELMRLIPGLYSFWLRLFWGAKIGRLTFWAPGTKILDRNFLEIGDNVIFAADVRLNPHVIENEELILAPVIIENNVIVGAYSLLTAGTVLKTNQATKAFLISPPFSIWDNNKRIRNQVNNEN